MSSLRLGSKAPDFHAITTIGESSFYQLTNDQWTVFFSHPADFTPVCTTELASLSKLQIEFNNRKVKLIGLSCDPIDSHHQWIQDIEKVYQTEIKFPIIADSDRSIAKLYDMLDNQDGNNKDSKGLPLTVRSVFIIDPSHQIRLIIQYPTTVGRNFQELLRVVDSLQLSSLNPISTPADWKQGEKVIINNNITDEQAKKMFKSDEVKFETPYLRFTDVPQ